MMFITRGHGAVQTTDVCIDCDASRPATKLHKIWKNYKSDLGTHWGEYAAHYQGHLDKLAAFRNGRGNSPISKHNKLRMLEFGVQSGGSARLWKQFYGDDLDYHSIKEDRAVQIESQLDAAAIIAVCLKHGPFDVIIDDGGHTYDMMKSTMDTVFRSNKCMKHHSLLVIEDMHMMVKEKSTKEKRQNGYTIPNLASEVFRKMHYYWANNLGDLDIHAPAGWTSPLDKMWADRTEEVALYDSMMFITRGDGPGPLKRIKRGTDGFDYDDRKANPDAYYCDFWCHLSYFFMI
jgi:hypothetical protein